MHAELLSVEEIEMLPAGILERLKAESIVSVRANTRLTDLIRSQSDFGDA